MEALTNSRLINKENYVNEIDKIFTRIDEIQEKLENVDEDDDEHVNHVKLDLYPEQIELLEDKAEKLQSRRMRNLTVLLKKQGMTASGSSGDGWNYYEQTKRNRDRL